MYGNSAASTCGTRCSATLFVTGSDFFAGNMTIANDYSKTSDVPSQAVAVSVRADRAVFRKVRLLGAQDTLYASSMGCMNGAQPGADCVPVVSTMPIATSKGMSTLSSGTQRRCSTAVSPSIAHAAGGYLTAQSNTRPGQDAGYVFNHCKITADAGAGDVYLGRPWRDYSTVIFMNTDIEAPIMAEGWSDWKGAPQPRLPMATYAEFKSTGPGANPTAREPYSKQLTAAEAKRYETKAYLAGADGWNPTTVKVRHFPLGLKSRVEDEPLCCG